MIQFIIRLRQKYFKLRLCHAKWARDRYNAKYSKLTYGVFTALNPLGAYWLFRKRYEGALRKMCRLETRLSYWKRKFPEPDYPFWWLNAGQDANDFAEEVLGFKPDKLEDLNDDRP